MAKVFKLPANTGNYPVKGFLPCHLSVQVILVICRDLMSVSVTGDPTAVGRMLHHLWFVSRPALPLLFIVRLWAFTALS